MKIDLTRSIQVEQLEVIAEIHFQEEKMSYKTVLELGQNKQINKTTLEPLFKNYNDQIRSILIERILQYLEQKGYIDGRGNLTSEGTSVAQNGLVKIPEKGKYLLWCIDDAMLKKRILHFDRKSYKDNQYTQLETKEFRYSELQQQNFIDLLDMNGKSFFIQRFERHGSIPYKLIDQNGGKLTLKWNIEFDEENTITSKTTLTGSLKIDKDENKQIKPQEEQYPLDLHQLHEILSMFYPDRWDRGLSALRMDFQDIPAQSRESFTLTETKNNINIPDKGTFEKINVEDIPIMPSNGECAREWFEANLIDKASGNFVFGTELKEYMKKFKANKVMKEFASYLDFDLRELCSKTQKTESLRIFWQLMTGIDLDLTEFYKK